MAFVFGANEAGRHGKGAALFAKKYYGAIYGQGVGFQGNSYGIPTKDKYIKTLPLEKIEIYIKDFLEFAKENPLMNFYVSKVGCGLAGYVPTQIAPFFSGHSDNIHLNEQFKEVLTPIEDEDKC